MMFLVLSGVSPINVPTMVFGLAKEYRPWVTVVTRGGIVNVNEVVVAYFIVDLRPQT